MWFEVERTRDAFQREEYHRSRHSCALETTIAERRGLCEVKGREANARTINGHADVEPGVDPTRQEALARLAVDDSDAPFTENRLVLGGVTLAAVDEVVNLIDSGRYGSGQLVDGTVRRCDVRALTRERRECRRSRFAQNVATRANDLRSRYVLHTVSTTYDGTKGTFQHRVPFDGTSVHQARRMRLWHIAYPIVGLGSKRLPPFHAMHVTIDALRQARPDPAAPTRTCVVLDAGTANVAYDRAFSELLPSAGNGGAARAQPR